MSYQERKRLTSQDTEVILKALPSGNSVGGTAWHLEYNKLSIIYALDLHDKETPISLPLQFALFKGANLMITNGYIQPLQNGMRINRIYNYVNEEKLRTRLEDVLFEMSAAVDRAGQVMIPITSKNRILHMLVLLDDIVAKSTKLQSQANRATGNDEKPVLYLEYMSRDTLDVAKSHLNWMNFKGSFQDIEDNPFAFKHIKPISSLQELTQELEARKPRVIVTSSASLELGFGRKHLKDFVSESTNMIIFTEQEIMSERCLAQKILQGDKVIRDCQFHRIGSTQQRRADTDGTFGVPKMPAPTSGLGHGPSEVSQQILPSEPVSISSTTDARAVDQKMDIIGLQKGGMTSNQFEHKAQSTSKELVPSHGHEDITGVAMEKHGSVLSMNENQI